MLGKDMFHPSPRMPLPPSLLYCMLICGDMPFLAGGISRLYCNDAVPRLLAVGGAMRFIFSDGSAAFTSVIIVGA